MLGILIKLTPGQLPNIQSNKSIKLGKTIIDKIKVLKQETPDKIAVIGIHATGKTRSVIMTAQIKSIASNQQGLNLEWLKVFHQKDKWGLPHGYAESHDFIEHGFEFLDTELDVLSCLVKSPSTLVRPTPPKLPAGFKWITHAASNLIIEFDNTGQPVLHSRRSHDYKVLGCFNNYTEALSQVWAKMSGTDFEQSMKELFERLGFKVEHCQYTKQGGDGGVDLVLVREDEILGLDRYVVQCKNYQINRKVDAPIINQLKGAAPTKNAQRCIIVTTSSFTDPARKTAQENGIPVQLIDGRDLSKLILPRVQELPSIQRLLNC